MKKINNIDAFLREGIACQRSKNLTTFLKKTATVVTIAGAGALLQGTGMLDEPFGVIAGGLKQGPVEIAAEPVDATGDTFEKALSGALGQKIEGVERLSNAFFGEDSSIYVVTDMTYEESEVLAENIPSDHYSPRTLNRGRITDSNTLFYAANSQSPVALRINSKDKPADTALGEAEKSVLCVTTPHFSALDESYGHLERSGMIYDTDYMNAAVVAHEVIGHCGSDLEFPSFDNNDEPDRFYMLAVEEFRADLASALWIASKEGAYKGLEDTILTMRYSSPHDFGHGTEDMLISVLKNIPAQDLYGKSLADIGDKVDNVMESLNVESNPALKVIFWNNMVNRLATTKGFYVRALQEAIKHKDPASAKDGYMEHITMYMNSEKEFTDKIGEYMAKYPELSKLNLQSFEAHQENGAKVLLQNVVANLTLQGSERLFKDNVDAIASLGYGKNMDSTSVDLYRKLGDITSNEGLTKGDLEAFQKSYGVDHQEREIASNSVLKLIPKKVFEREQDSEASHDHEHSYGM